jgi:glycosyltransferase involved in cell wall biosynthesis
MKILFIGSCIKKRKHPNGESVKSRDFYEALLSLGHVTLVNLIDHQLFQMAKFFWCVIFRKYDYIIIGKAPTGGSRLLRYLRFFHYPSNKIIFYTYGRGLRGSFSEKVKPEQLSYAGALIVETKDVKKEFTEDGLKNLYILPCVKKTYDIPDEMKNEAKPVLRLIFFSRIIKDKGVLEAVDTVIAANKKGIKFSLDITGSVKEEPETVELVKKRIQGHPEIRFLGEDFKVTGPETYQELNRYDLHVLPTRFFHENAPGSIIDMFVSWVPTLTTRFPGYEDMLSEENSYLIDFQREEQLLPKLLYIFSHQNELFLKRAACHAELHHYDFQAAYQVLGSITHGKLSSPKLDSKKP